MTKEERVRIGRKLRALRAERNLHQVDVANDPKVALSVGTLQAIEGAWYEVRDTNIEKLARFYGTSVMKLLKGDQPKVVAPTHPLLKDINEEHLAIAQAYKNARKGVRASIELLINHPDEERRLTTIVLKLGTYTKERLAQIDAMLDGHAENLILWLGNRIQKLDPAEIPAFLALVQATLDEVDRNTTARKLPETTLTKKVVKKA